jgi:hypothetical protein
MEAAREHALALDARQDARDIKAVDAGHTHTVCTRCGNTRNLSWARGHCNEFSADTDDQMCGGTYRTAGGC